MSAPAPPTALYGCMGLGGSWDDPSFDDADLARAEAAVEAALDAGITWFDHADIYTAGGAEAVFGALLARHADLRARVVLQSKCGITLPRDGAVGHYDWRPAHVRERVERSLERLRTDHLDVLLLHRPDPLADLPAVAATLEELHREGLVGAVGLSNASHHQLAALQAHLALPLVVDQLEMSLHHRSFVEAGVLVDTDAGATGFPLGTLEHCAARGVALQAWGALAQGRYTGRAETAADEATTALVARLAADKGTTPETVVLWWLRRHPVGIAPVVGTTDPGRIAACRDAVVRAPDLTHEEWYALWVTARGAPLP